ncbi:13209_t:CDS:2 [Cetraspora pellucida]|uniref:13209_t:CDS:1 n=1 Tax=Cetraspora pellucida TaxID=1433469 RepID=A0ACA9JZB8_9GLOM|nr:13209_t:CDS:2 [Cetraspora pellucida]
MEEFEDDINDIDVNSWYSSVLESYFNTNETSELEENNFASTSAETSSNTTSYSDYVGTTQCKNQSHTNYFFRSESNNKEIAYCKICENNLKDTQQKPYPYVRKRGNTSNLSAHLRDKHKITSDNYKQFLDETSKPNIDQTKLTDFYKKSAPCTTQRQTYLSQLLIKFIIRFVEPLYILEDEDFREFVNGCEPGYRIPCVKSAKNMIYRAYDWNVDQLHKLISNTAGCVHLTTDLWTAKSKHSYIGIMGTWLTEDFVFKEVLLICSELLHPHSGEIISAELFSIIQKWNLSSLVYTITTDNTTNMIKGVHILKLQLSEVTRQACAAHTLQLTVQQGLKQCKVVHRRIKNLIAFFRLPKQAQRLYEAQLQIKGTDISNNQNENNNFNPLNVLSETKTRWNSTYLAWKRVLELYTAMKLVSTTLLSKKDRSSQLEGEKLDRLCLTIDEKNCIQSILEDLPNQPNIEKLSDTDDSSSVSEDENISSAGKGKSNVSQRLQNKSVESNDIYEIEYLPPTDTSGLLDNVRAAIYLSLDELWCVPNDIALVASILDPRMKSLRFTTDTQRTNTRIKLSSNITTFSENDTLGDDDFFAEVFNLGRSNNDIIEFEEDESRVRSVLVASTLYLNYE